jgi:drug/metabolite transporter (DMT)-like permease
MTNQGKAYLFAGIAIFFWSTVATAFKIALRNLDFVQLLFIATWTSFLVYVMVFLLSGNKISFLKIKKNELIHSAILGLINPFIYYLILFKAYSLLPAQVAQPLNMIWPIILVFLSILFLKQKIAFKSFVALFISFAGVYIVSSQGNPFASDISEPFGVILATGSSIIWSVYWIFNVRDSREEVRKLLLSFFFAGIYISILLPFMTDLTSINLTGAIMAAYSGIFEMGITFLLWLKALKLTTTTDKISNLVYLAPFLSLIFIHIFVGEKIYWTTVLGLCLIITGILLEKIHYISKSN